MDAVPSGSVLSHLSWRPHVGGVLSARLSNGIDELAPLPCVSVVSVTSAVMANAAVKV